MKPSKLLPPVQRGAFCRPPNNPRQHTAVRFGQTGTIISLRNPLYSMFHPDGCKLKFMVFSSDLYIPNK